MTAREAISRFDERRPNSIPAPHKLARLAELEDRIARDLLRRDPAPLTPESELSARGFDMLYHFWLCALFDLEAGDYARFRLDCEAADARYAEYAAAVCRARAYGAAQKELQVIPGGNAR